LPYRFRRQMETYRYGPGVFKVDWALSAPIPWRAAECARAGTIHVGGSLDEIAASERTLAGSTASERPFILVSQPSLFDASRAPAGRHTAWAYCHVPHGSAADMTERIESQVERFAPGFRARILARHAMTPADLERHNANVAAHAPAVPDAAGGRVSVLLIHAARRSGARHVRLSRGARRFAPAGSRINAFRTRFGASYKSEAYPISGDGCYSVHTGANQCADPARLWRGQRTCHG
jgi:hypothetical protein